jgi:2-polyprenyl-6-methoxyphenol hydroxylase-like FAD-dependent oxidoreductase
MPWGVAEAKALGIFDLLISACGHCNQWAIGLGPDRDLVATTIQGLPILSFYHPAMQETLIAAAQGAGAETRRGATTQSATPGAPSIVEFECDGHATRVSARLVVGADGRASNVRE